MLVMVLLGSFTNYCSFVTFKRKQPRLVGVGNYILFVTILSHCSLLILFLKFIAIVFRSVGLTNNISCKIISYLLSVSTRSTYWLTSWITINRLLTTIYPVSLRVKNPYLAIYISLGTLLIVLLMHVHEILFYQTIQESDFSVSGCFANFRYSAIKVYNRFNTLIHYLVPFCIQIISTILLFIFIARIRVKAKGKTINKNKLLQFFKTELLDAKELFVIPIIVILSALPQTILSFSLACSQLSSWKRHTLLVTIFLTYLPQTLGFILHVLPSSTYKKEFGQTLIAKKMFKCMFKTDVQKNNAKGVKK